jgi:hypothetical protein
LSSVTLSKAFDECFSGFAECFRHSAKRLIPVVSGGPTMGRSPRSLRCHLRSLRDSAPFTISRRTMLAAPGPPFDFILCYGRARSRRPLRQRSYVQISKCDITSRRPLRSMIGDTFSLHPTMMNLGTYTNIYIKYYIIH